MNDMDDDGFLTMNDANRAIDDGNEDLIGLTKIVPKALPMCQATVPFGPQSWHKWKKCSYAARFINVNGLELCHLHAIKWAQIYNDNLKPVR